MSSRPFDARRTAGTCYFCSEALCAGERVLFLTARAVGDTPGRPLNARELRIWRRLGRERKAARAERRRGRRTPDPVAPEWLWDRMVHVPCARNAGFPIPGGMADARPGTRSVGHHHGAQTNAATAPESDAQRQAREAMEALEAQARQARQAEAQARRERREREARERAEARRQAREAREAQARAEREAAEREAAEAEAFERLRREEPGAARFRLLNLDDDAPRQDEDDDGDDPSVERFRRLDLD